MMANSTLLHQQMDGVELTDELYPDYQQFEPFIDYDPCDLQIDEHIAIRFYLVAVLGTSFALLSVLENLLAFYALISKRKYRNSHFMYLIFLALFDVGVSLSYFLLFGVHVIVEYTRYLKGSEPPNALQLTLVKAWWFYFRQVYGASQVSLTATGYLIVVATWERFLITAKSNFLPIVRRNRFYICLGAALLCVAIKATSFFEFDLLKNYNCTGLSEYMPGQTEFRMSFTNHIYSVYIRNVIAVILPFVLLALLNIFIVVILKQQQRSATMFGFESAEHRHRVKSATRMLVCVVFCYLIANVLNVVVTIWEVIDFEGLREKYFKLYTYAADTVSLLTILMCALRLPIYLLFNQQMRTALRNVFCCCPAKRPTQQWKSTTQRRYKLENSKNGFTRNNETQEFPLKEINLNAQKNWTKWHTELSPLVSKVTTKTTSSNSEEIVDSEF